MVYFLLTQDLFQVSEAHETFPAEYGKAMETGPFPVTMTRICVFGSSGSFFKDTWRLRLL